MTTIAAEMEQTVHRPAISPAPAPDAAAAIDVRELVRRYGGFTAVDRLSFTVGRGEFFGFLGPNGAGKSTTIKMLCTLLRPHAGSARVNGFDVAREPARVRESIGIVFQDYSLDDRITAEENLRFHCMIYHVPRRERAARIARVLAMVDLTDRARDKVRTFSGGMKRRLEIARGLLHHPAILFLDEPTVGLDPQTRESIWAHVHELRRREGITVFLTTHYMDEADQCDRIGIIDHARLIALDTPAALKAGIGGDVVRLKTVDNPTAAGWLRDEQRLEPAIEDGTVRIEVPAAGELLPALLTRLPVSVRAVDIAKPTLNDVFLRLTGRAIREESADSRDNLRTVLRMRGGRGA